MHRKGNQTHTNLWVEAANSFHQANITFLDQVCLRQAVTGVITGNMSDKAQVRQDELLSGFQIALIMQPFSQLPLFLCRQHRIGVGGPDIGFQTALGH
ncbi:hypothetical protein D3C75_149690 [compost metagenome]